MPSHRHHIINSLSGAEIFTFLTEKQSEHHVSAADLKTYCGGDVAAPSIRPERGAHPVKNSEFPNAEFSFRPGDVVCGLQGGLNVNFTYEQIVAGVVAAIAKNQG